MKKHKSREKYKINHCYKTVQHNATQHDPTQVNQLNPTQHNTIQYSALNNTYNAIYHMPNINVSNVQRERIKVEVMKFDFLLATALNGGQYFY